MREGDNRMKYVYFILCVIQALIIQVIQLPFMIAGIFIIPIALLFRKEGAAYYVVDFAGHKDCYNMVNLPSWAWLWDNEWDGAMGDDQLRYWNRDRPECLAGSGFLKMYFWLAFRNPINNLSRFYFSCDVSKETPKLIAGDFDVRDKKGYEGWQLVRAGWKLGFYYVQANNKPKAWVSRIGFKIEPRAVMQVWDDPKKALKGCTFKPFMYKDA